MISIFILIVLNESHADTYAHFLLVFIRQGNRRIYSSSCQRTSHPDENDSHSVPTSSLEAWKPSWGRVFQNVGTSRGTCGRTAQGLITDQSEGRRPSAGLPLRWMSPCWLPGGRGSFQKQDENRILETSEVQDVKGQERESPLVPPVHLNEVGHPSLWPSS